jgi:hypothetical protein
VNLLAAARDAFIGELFPDPVTQSGADRARRFPRYQESDRTVCGLQQATPTLDDTLSQTLVAFAVAEDDHQRREEFAMLKWLANWAVHNALTPEKQAERALRQLRLELFQAEQRILDAQMHADYYRARLTFCENVIKNGIEQVADQRKGQQETSQASRPALKLTATQ